MPDYSAVGGAKEQRVFFVENAWIASCCVKQQVHSSKSLMLMWHPGHFSGKCSSPELLL